MNVEEETSLAEFTHFAPQGKERNIKVAYIDRFDSVVTRSNILSMEGFDILCVRVITVPRHVPADIGLLASRALSRKIIEWEPRWVISHMDLEGIDGIDLIRTCREAGISTIMITGAPKTQEIKNIANYLLSHLYNTGSLVDILTTPQPPPAR